MNDDYSIFDLDQDKLPEEWLEQPRIYYQKAVKLADAKAEYERMKSIRDVTEAELSRDIRKDPTAFGLNKITEEGIKKIIPLQVRYQKTDTDVIDAKHKMDILSAVVEALEHRKKALENLVQLQLSSFRASPKEPSSYTSSSAIRQREIDEAFRPRQKKPLPGE